MATFEPMVFAALLRKAIGNRTVNQFAKDTGLSRYQISRRLSASLESPPRKTTLVRIALNAQGGVTYEDLLSASGYAEESLREGAGRKAPAEDEARRAKAAVLANISDLDKLCRLTSDTPKIPCDFELLLGEEPSLRWDFSCIPGEVNRIEVEKAIDDHYLSLLYTRLGSYFKMSFLTKSEDIFNTCLQKKPENLSANVSVILYEDESLSVLKEEEISRSSTDPLPDAAAFSFRRN